ESVGTARQRYSQATLDNIGFLMPVKRVFHKNKPMQKNGFCFKKQINNGDSQIKFFWLLFFQEK
ncbi:MAG: hypothetical protein J6K12_01230, partial [Clostridia bacterium]|nr:hypothetical protein [Clostridia bacterium]